LVPQKLPQEAEAQTSERANRRNHQYLYEGRVIREFFEYISFVEVKEFEINKIIATCVVGFGVLVWISPTEGLKGRKLTKIQKANHNIVKTAFADAFNYFRVLYYIHWAREDKDYNEIHIKCRARKNCNCSRTFNFRIKKQFKLTVENLDALTAFIPVFRRCGIRFSSGN
jgi:hypothetical protein